MQVRLATQIGKRISLRVYSSGTCNNGSYCNSMKHLRDEIQDPVPLIMELAPEQIEDFKEEEWPHLCQYCGNEIVNGTKQIFQERLYDTPSGRIEPGCLYWNTWYPEDYFWTNHTGYHLVAMLPNGREWCIDSRASNCTMPDDKLHRCWVRHGEVPNIHVDKQGHTCEAGAGSIWVGDYHGFLHNGHFTNA
jgi:hypothetical protein